MKKRDRKVRIVAFIVLAFFTVNALLVIFPALLAKADESAKTYVSVTLDGEYINFDALPYIVNQRTIVPVRFLMEALNAEVSWDSEKRKVTIVGEGVKMELYADSTKAYLNGKGVTLDVSAEIRYDRVFVPLRFVSENMGLTVGWNGASKTVVLKTTDKTPAKPSEVKEFTFNSVKASGKNLIFNMSAKGFEYKTTLLKEPTRLVVDIHSCINKLVAAPFSATDYVKAFRYSQFTVNPNAVRFVMELKDNVLYDIEAQGANLIIAFRNEGEKPEKIDWSSVADNKKEETEEKEENKKEEITDEKEEENEKGNEEAEVPREAKPIEETVIVIDPGHGGSDPGACGYDADGNVILKEKEPNLYISMKLYELLKEKGFKVYVTRDSDVYVDLIGRADMANELDADFFVSIHNNASENYDVRGTMVMYAYDTPKKNMYLSGKEMATIIQKHLVSAIEETTDYGPMKNSALAVLKRTEMPAVIVEGLFVSNEKDRALLMDNKTLDSIAEAVYDGILEITEK